MGVAEVRGRVEWVWQRNVLVIEVYEALLERPKDGDKGHRHSGAEKKNVKPLLRVRQSPYTSGENSPVDYVGERIENEGKGGSAAENWSKVPHDDGDEDCAKLHEERRLFKEDVDKPREKRQRKRQTADG